MSTADGGKDDEAEPAEGDKVESILMGGGKQGTERPSGCWGRRRSPLFKHLCIIYHVYDHISGLQRSLKG
jgi:hypothetical protein